MFLSRLFATLCIASLASWTLALECKDSELKFVLRGKNKVGGPKNSKDCDWVKSKKNKRCNKNRFAKFCPILCEKPKFCNVDVTEKFEVSHKKQGNNTIKKSKYKTCFWASQNKKKKRCGKKGVADICRATCSAFPAPSSVPSVSPSSVPSVSPSSTLYPSSVPSDVTVRV